MPDRPRGERTHPGRRNRRPARAGERDRGRNPDAIEVSFFWPTPEADALKRLRDMGVARGVLALPPVGKDEALKMLDGMAGLVDQVK